MTCAEGGDDGKTGVGIGCGTSVGGGTTDGRDSIVESMDVVRAGGGDDGKTGVRAGSSTTIGVGTTSPLTLLSAPR